MFEAFVIQSTRDQALILLHRKAKAGLTFEKIAASLGRGEVYVASIFYGQMKPDDSDITKLAEVLSMSAEVCHCLA